MVHHSYNVVTNVPQATYEKLEGELKELNSSIEALRRNQGELQELRHVLQHTDSFLAEVSPNVL